MPTEKEEQRLSEEFERYRQLGPLAYVKANPLPPGAVAWMPAGVAQEATLGEAIRQYQQIPRTIALVPEAVADIDVTRLKPGREKDSVPMVSPQPPKQQPASAAERILRQKQERTENKDQAAKSDTF